MMHIKNVSFLFLLLFITVSCGNVLTNTNNGDDDAVDAVNNDEDSVESVCGDGIVAKDEVCDGNLGVCTDIDPKLYKAGKAHCNSDCQGWDVRTCDEMTGDDTDIQDIDDGDRQDADSGDTLSDDRQDEDSGDTQFDDDSSDTSDTGSDDDIEVVCKAGMHLEEEATGDENGDGKIEGCVENVGCGIGEPPCHGHGACTDVGMTSLCECTAAYGGRWCDECAEGYQDNNKTGYCNQSCELWDPLDDKCSGLKSCDDTHGAAFCMCPNGYTGADCEVCDSAVYCNDHASDCSVDILGERTCTCSDNYAGKECKQCIIDYYINGAEECVPCLEGYVGMNCADCAGGYQDYRDIGVCKLDCDDECGGSDVGTPPWESHGSCIYDASNNASCGCETHWVDLNIVNVMSCDQHPCAQCDIRNPPADKPNGCEASCGKDGDTGEYNMCYKAGEKTTLAGLCYYDKNDSDCDPTGGSDMFNCGPINCGVYCICGSGYTLAADGKTCNPN